MRSDDARKGKVEQKRKSPREDERGFTGLEAAIVLTSFVVVAAVFSYVVLNAGFFSSQKAEEVVHTGVEQVTSSFDIAGNIIGFGWTYNRSAFNNMGSYYDPAASSADHHNTDTKNMTVIQMGLTLTAGKREIDMDKLTITYTDEDTHQGALNFTRTNYTDAKGVVYFTASGMPKEWMAQHPSYNVSESNMSMGNWTYYTADTPGATHNRMLEPGEIAVIIITLPGYGSKANKKGSSPTLG